MVSYTLESGVQLHLAAPATFYLPPAEMRENLGAWDIVKLVFAIEHNGGTSVERMWVIVEDRTTQGYRGILNNDPVCTAELKAGEVVIFGPEHVIQIYEEDDDRNENAD